MCSLLTITGEQGSRGAGNRGAHEFWSDDGGDATGLLNLSLLPTSTSTYSVAVKKDDGRLPPPRPLDLILLCPCLASTQEDGIKT